MSWEWLGVTGWGIIQSVCTERRFTDYRPKGTMDKFQLSVSNVFSVWTKTNSGTAEYWNFTILHFCKTLTKKKPSNPAPSFCYCLWSFEILAREKFEPPFPEAKVHFNLNPYIGPNCQIWKGKRKQQCYYISIYLLRHSLHSEKLHQGSLCICYGKPMKAFFSPKLLSRPFPSKYQDYPDVVSLCWI